MQKISNLGELVNLPDGTIVYNWVGKPDGWQTAFHLRKIGGMFYHCDINGDIVPIDNKAFDWTNEHGFPPGNVNLPVWVLGA